MLEEYCPGILGAMADKFVQSGQPNDVTAEYGAEEAMGAMDISLWY